MATNNRVNSNFYQVGVEDANGNITGLVADHITATVTANLGTVTAVTITGGSSGQVLSTDGTGNLSWVNQGGGGGTPGGTNTQVQFNNSGVFGGSDAFLFDTSTQTVTVGNTATTSTLRVFSNANQTAPWRIEEYPFGFPGWTRLRGPDTDATVGGYPTMYIQSGQAVDTSTSSVFGGYLYIQASDGSGPFSFGGGAIGITSGTAQGEGPGGNIDITAGGAVGTGNGGNVTITSGAATGGGSNGTINLVSDLTTIGSDTNGGQVNIYTVGGNLTETPLRIFQIFGPGSGPRDAIKAGTLNSGSSWPGRGKILMLEGGNNILGSGVTGGEVWIRGGVNQDTGLRAPVYITSDNGVSIDTGAFPITLNGSNGTTGQVLTSQGNSAAPIWATSSGGQDLISYSTCGGV